MGDANTSVQFEPLSLLPSYVKSGRCKMFPNVYFANKLNILRAESTWCFSDLESQKGNFELFNNPFTVDVETVPIQLQMELIQLHCERTITAKHDSAGFIKYIRSIPETMPQLRQHVAQTLSMFVSIYLCEKLFSLTKTNKTAHRSCLTDEHLHSILRKPTTANLKPNLNDLVAKRRC